MSIYHFTDMYVRSPSELNWVLCLQSHKAKVKLSVRLHFHLEALDKNPSRNSFRLLAEFNSLQLEK